MLYCVFRLFQYTDIFDKEKKWQMFNLATVKSVLTGGLLKLMEISDIDAAK